MNFSKFSAFVAFFILASISDPCLGDDSTKITTKGQQSSTLLPTTIQFSTGKPISADSGTTLPPGKLSSPAILLTTTVAPISTPTAQPTTGFVSTSTNKLSVSDSATATTTPRLSTTMKGESETTTTISKVYGKRAADLTSSTSKPAIDSTTVPSTKSDPTLSSSSSSSTSKPEIASTTVLSTKSDAATSRRSDMVTTTASSLKLSDAPSRDVSTSKPAIDLTTVLSTRIDSNTSKSSDNVTTVASSPRPSDMPTRDVPTSKPVIDSTTVLSTKSDLHSTTSRVSTTIKGESETTTKGKVYGKRAADLTSTSSTPTSKPAIDLTTILSTKSDSATITSKRPDMVTTTASSPRPSDMPARNMSTSELAINSTTVLSTKSDLLSTTSRVSTTTTMKGESETTTTRGKVYGKRAADLTLSTSKPAIDSTTVLSTKSDPTLSSSSSKPAIDSTTVLSTKSDLVSTTSRMSTTIKGESEATTLATTTKGKVYGKRGAGWMKHKPKPKKTPRPTATPTPAALETTSELQHVTTTEKLVPEATTTLQRTKPTTAEATTKSQSIPIETTKAMKEETTTLREESQPSTLAITMGGAQASSMAGTLAPSPKRRTRRPKPNPVLPHVDFDCRQKDDGYYADPKDKCSSIYYACVGHLARKMICGSEIGNAKLVYEPETGRCEHRDDSFSCTGQRKTTLKSTKSPTKQPLKLDLDCSKLSDGFYADPKLKCSHIFYSCSGAVAAKFECPGHGYFDETSKTCLQYEDVVACSGPKPATKPPKPTTPAGPKEKLPIDCTNKASGQYEDPTKKCSDVYYVCSNGDGIKRKCPHGTKYDAKKKLCEWSDEVPACAGPKKPTKAPTPSPAPSQASLLSTEFDCTGKRDASYLPAGKKCSNIYFRCVGGLARKMSCPKDLYFDIKKDLCERWADLHACSGKQPTNAPATKPTTKPAVTEKNPIDCAKFPDGDYPDPKKACSTVYYSCGGGLGVDISFKRRCPPTTFFDKDSKICDIKDHVPACSGKARPTTIKATPGPKMETTKAPYDCKSKSDGNYPSGKCHPKYWSCVGGTTIRADCPKGTFYDREMDECSYKEEIPDCGGVRPTEQPIKTTKS